MACKKLINSLKSEKAAAVVLNYTKWDVRKSSEYICMDTNYLFFFFLFYFFFYSIAVLGGGDVSEQRYNLTLFK